MSRPRTIEELAKKATDYDFYPNISFRSWIHVAHTLLREADTYRAEKDHASESYFLYARFCDLVLMKLPDHPESGQKANVKLLNKMMPEIDRALQKMELVRQIVIEENKQWENIQQTKHQDSQQQGQSQQLIDSKYSIDTLHSSDHTSHNTPTLAQAHPQLGPTADDKSYQETLKALRNLGGKNNMTSMYGDFGNKAQNIALYPQIPQRTSSLDARGQLHSLNTVGPALPQRPPLQQTHQLQINKHHDRPLTPVTVHRSTVEQPPLPPRPRSTHLDDHNRNSITTSTGITEDADKAPGKAVHQIRSYTESGAPLRTIFLPKQLERRFLEIARPNTTKNLETCGILCGVLNRNAFIITHLVIPKQESTSDTCGTTDEELLFEYVDENDLFILGWIHTHPTQSCFMSSVDLHTQNSYQIMLPEAIAIVCAPQHNPSFGIFRLSDPPGIDIIKSCKKSSTFHPHPEENLYKLALPGHVKINNELPFKLQDLR